VGGVEVVGEAGSANEALQLIKAIRYDVVFLDINMPALSGIDLAETLAGLAHPPAIVFVTAHSEHAVKAFEVAAVDYLVKRLRRSPADRDGAYRPAAEEPVRIERVPVEKAGKKLLLDVHDMTYIMAKGRLQLHLHRRRAVPSTLSLAQLEARLEPRASSGSTAGFS